MAEGPKGLIISPMTVSAHIVVTTDFSAAAERAFTYVPAMARGLEARVTVLHVLDVEPLALGQLEQAESQEKRREAEAHAGLDRVREAHLADLGDVKTVLMRAPRAVDGICTFARDHRADLIVIATHGRTGLAHLLIGSVAEKVARHASCPVLSVPIR